MSRSVIAFFLLPIVIIATYAISCNDKTDNFVAHDLSITPPIIELGESVLIEFHIDNKGYRGVLSTWTLEIDNEKVTQKSIRAEERNTTRGYFTYTADSTGNHTVSVNTAGDERLGGWFLVVDSEDGTSKD
jgi:hypothetical protein